MCHKNYFEINAKNYYELGLKEGELFGDFLQNSIEEQKSQYSWDEKLLAQSRYYLEKSRMTFPHLIEELEGYARGAGVAFDDLWILSLEEELFESGYDKCTSIITNNGLLVAHNEDWDSDSKDSICILRKNIEDLTILELFYLDTLGGNSISVNSHGFVQTVNTLTHTDRQIGVPKNIIARWLSETRDPEKDYYLLSKMKRSSGYNHNLVSINGNIWNIECSAKEQKLTKPRPPFAHTNHYLTELSRLEADDNSCGTFSRYRYASSRSRDKMSVDQIKDLMSNASEGKRLSIFNNMTIARMIIDLEKRDAYIWLLREKNKGWLRYGLNSIPPHRNL
jgi:hypothetical protein